MKVLFDQNVPRPLLKFLTSHEVKVADRMGWAELENGLLLATAEKAGFDVLLSSDKTIRHKQDMTGRRIALLYMSDNHWPIIRHYVPAIVEAIDRVKPGEIKAVFCGTFRSRKARRVNDG